MVSAAGIIDFFRGRATFENDIVIPRHVFRSDGILDWNGLCGSQLCIAQPILDIVVVKAPFPQIPVHIIQSECIALLKPDRHYGSSFSVRDPPVIRNVRKRIAVVRGIDCVSVAKSASCQCPARKFPLGLSWQIELVSA